jgi:splicing factor 3B subunit 3
MYTLLAITRTVSFALIFVVTHLHPGSFFYQFEGTGDDEAAESSSVKMETDDVVYFSPRPLKNLRKIDELSSLAPIVDMKVMDLFREETPQIYTLCGRGPRSTLRILRHGLAVTDLAESGLPGNPTAVWTVRKSIRDDYDKYIVVSFPTSTLVLAVGETVEEIHDSGFLGTTSTLIINNIGDDGLLQVHPNGIRHIKGDKRVNEWRTPGKKTIFCAAANEFQVAIALSGGEISLLLVLTVIACTR